MQITERLWKVYQAQQSETNNMMSHAKTLSWQRSEDVLHLVWWHIKLCAFAFFASWRENKNSLLQ